jgi:hypothetical protein
MTIVLKCFKITVFPDGDYDKYNYINLICMIFTSIMTIATNCFKITVFPDGDYDI